MEAGNYKHYLRPQGRGLKLHLGCGDYWFDGYINIDIGIYGGTDLIWDIREKLPFQDHVVERIEAYEVVEHFSQNEVSNILEEWKRLLIIGGKVKISVPNMDKIIEMYTQDKDKAIQTIYGYEQCPNHKWGYTAQTLKKVFEEHGFKNVIVILDFLDERPEEPKLILEATYES